MLKFLLVIAINFADCDLPCFALLMRCKRGLVKMHFD